MDLLTRYRFALSSALSCEEQFHDNHNKTRNWTLCVAIKANSPQTRLEPLHVSKTHQRYAFEQLRAINKLVVAFRNALDQLLLPEIVWNLIIQ